MRLLIAAGFIGRFGETDGVVTTYQNLIPFFVKAGIKADFVAYGDQDNMEKWGSVRVFSHRPRCPIKIDPIRWVDPALMLSGKIRRLSSRKYDLVQCSTPEFMGLWALKIARKNSSPMISLYHTALDQYAEIRTTQKFGKACGKLTGRIVNRWLLHFFNQARLVLAPSEAVRSQLLNFLSSDVNIIARGIDGEKFNPAYRMRSDNKVRVIYVGRVAPEKNMQLLVKIFKTISGAGLTVVGDGPYLPIMKRELPNANFCGRLSGQLLSQAYADGDIFVFPSHTDTFGNVVLEAMSSGLPVIVTDSLGPCEIIDNGVDGFVTHSEEEFRDAVVKLIENPGLRRTMGRSARRAAERRSWESIFETLCGYYQTVLGTFPMPASARKAI